jgi:hypothetical protein
MAICSERTSPIAILFATPMATSISTHRTEPWRRFTVLDALLLQAGYGVAFSLLFTPFRDRAFDTIDAGSLFLVLTTACLGSVLTGPIVLGSHWLFRGRRDGLSAGEWLWLSPIVLIALGLLGVWAIHWITYTLPDSKEVRAIFFAVLGLVLLLVEIGCVLNALLVAMARPMGDLITPPCPWADRFGALTCLATGALVLLTVFAVLS